MHGCLKDIDVVILCGGLGTRLAGVVPDKPKSMAEVGARPLLDILIDSVAEFGARRIILCVGHKAGYIEEYYAKRDIGPQITYSFESKPLGTGGALKNAQLSIKSGLFLAMNGDTVCGLNYSHFFHFHKSKQALVTVALAKMPESHSFGNVRIDSFFRIVDFNEKPQGSSNLLVSVGIYLMGKEIFALMPERDSFSLERDFFPSILKKRFYGFLTKEKFIDIGTPQGYKKALSRFRV